MTKEQKHDTALVFDNMNNWGLLDYVCCWYKKASQYIQGTNIEVGFVSTNSICQGEQVSTLWIDIIEKYNIKINFAHQTFKWSNEAKGKAAVYCVIVGFGLSDRVSKKLFQYATVIGDPSEIEAKQINAYLVDAPIIFIDKRSKPLWKVPEMTKGSSPTDDGNLLLSQEERDAILQSDPSLIEIIRPFTGAKEYLHNQSRYCIWLKDISPAKYNHSKEIMGRLAKVKEYRSKSNRTATKKYAQFPSLFVEIRQPDSDYIIVPRHSSENRQFIPIGFLDKSIIAGDATAFIPNATLYEFGVITSTMHMAWMRYVCGRIKSDYRYSNTIVYNNFPFPKPTNKQKEAIVKEAQGILDARKKYSELSLSDLYEATSMLPELLKAHQKLDKVVEATYGRTFTTDADRVTHLFNLYQEMTKGLFIEKSKQIKRK
jgi:hypothetical protein